MSVSSTVTVLRPMAKVVGVSLSLTLAFQLRNWPLGKRGPFHQTWFAERWESSFQPITSVNLGERRDPDGTSLWQVLGCQKRKQIWSLSDGETNYEELSPGDKLLILKSANELQKGKKIMHPIIFFVSA